MMLNVVGSARKFLVVPDCCIKKLEAIEGYRMMLDVVGSARKFLVDPDCW